MGFDLVTAIHESEYANLKRPPEPDHKFEVTLEPDNFTLEKYEVFKNYQHHVHKEAVSKISQDGFKRFLCDSPLQRTTRTVNGKTQKLGSFHQCYRVDGRLVAMGVLDLLPHCVSGVYLIYHSDFEKWSFGKLSAMSEIALTLAGGYQYYYMGYYIPSCAKMRYKGKYKPSYILDPETYEWNPLDGEQQELLDKKPYVSMSRERRLKERSTNSEADSADDLAEYLLPSAPEAGKAVEEEDMSLFDLKVPGLMTAEELEQGDFLDNINLKIKGLPRNVKTQVCTDTPKLWFHELTERRNSFLGMGAVCRTQDRSRDLLPSLWLVLGQMLRGR